MRRFEGKTVLIIGAARGQGASHARGFASEGANVVLADIREESGRALAEDLGGKAMFIRLDVSVASDWESVVEQTERRFGPISTLVNNAGVLAPAASIAESDPADWDNVLATNLKGAYLGIRAVASSLKRAGAARSSTSRPHRATSGRRCSRPMWRASGAFED